ncbi:MAG: DUF262 domain-containing protein [Burkholderiales bacterium]|nr:DUF262 domain-containing protein [Burkholderiales bacterium]
MATHKRTNREIEERYIEEDMQISQERSDFLLPQVLDFVAQKKWMNLQPEYQRRQVWDRSKQSRFIESLLMNLPTPPVFLFEPDYNRYEVMDGQQRLSSIVSFYENRLKLTGLEYWPELLGKYYSDLPLKVQRGLDRRRVSAVVLQSNGRGRNEDELRRIVFERLNTGGQKLNAQELRNCVYASPFASMLVELAGYPVFNDLLEIPRYEDHFIDDHVSAELAENALFKRMTDCEFVLRFFAFRERKNIKGAVKTILDRCMATNRKLEEADLEDLRADFKSRIDLAHDLLGADALKLTRPEGGKSSISQPYYDAIIVACDRLFTRKTDLRRKKAALAQALAKTTAKQDNYELIVGRANTADAIRRRLDFVEKCFASVL